jgi:hypothetical protein
MAFVFCFRNDSTQVTKFKRKGKKIKLVVIQLTLKKVWKSEKNKKKENYIDNVVLFFVNCYTAEKKRNSESDHGSFLDSSSVTKNNNDVTAKKLEKTKKTENQGSKHAWFRAGRQKKQKQKEKKETFLLFWRKLSETIKYFDAQKTKKMPYGRLLCFLCVETNEFAQQQKENFFRS